MTTKDGFPDLPDVEITLHRAPGGISAPAARLAEHVLESLRQPGLAASAGIAA